MSTLDFEGRAADFLMSGDAYALTFMEAEDFNPNYRHHRPGGYTLLHYAVAYDMRDVILKLIALGCDVSAVDDKGRTAATLAFEVADNPALGRYLYDVEYRQRAARTGGNG